MYEFRFTFFHGIAVFVSLLFSPPFLRRSTSAFEATADAAGVRGARAHRHQCPCQCHCGATRRRRGVGRSVRLCGSAVVLQMGGETFDDLSKRLRRRNHHHDHNFPPPPPPPPLSPPSSSFQHYHTINAEAHHRTTLGKTFICASSLFKALNCVASEDLRPPCPTLHFP